MGVGLVVNTNLQVNTPYSWHGVVYLELIFTMLGEASTTEIARNKDAQGYGENRNAALKGGAVAGKARRDLEKKSGKRIVSTENYKQLHEAVVRKRVKK